VSQLRSILIVEDDVPTCTLLEAVVRRNHFRAVVCGDGGTALEHLDAEEFAVILLDIRLPVIDGMEVLRRLASRAPQLLPRIIVVTALAQARLRACPQIEEVWCVVRKPFELRALEDDIRACNAAAS
jgi:DNA-binding response OmpR family regulator